MNSFFEDIELHISEELMKATTSIRIAVAWFTNKRLLKILEYKQKNGVNVEVVLNDDEINRKNLNFSTLESLGGKILFSNVEKTLMHCKFCVIDDTTIIAGSYNWTNKAETSNQEQISVITDNAQEVEHYNQYFQTIKNDIINNRSISTKWSTYNWRFIKTPYLYTKIGAGFSLVQQQIMWKLIEKMQSSSLFVSPLYKEEVNIYTIFSQNPPLIEIKLTDLKIAPSHYKDLEQSINMLRNYKVVISELNQQTNILEEKAIPLFETIDIPHHKRFSPETGKYQERRSGVLFLKLNSTIASIVLKMDRGYIYHMADIVDFCKKKYTPRIYLFLKRLQGLKRDSVSYIELKDYLGVTDKYPEWHKFQSRALDSAQKELSCLFQDGKSDIEFTYKPICGNGRKCGTPLEINFIIKSQV